MSGCYSGGGPAHSVDGGGGPAMLAGTPAVSYVIPKTTGGTDSVAAHRGSVVLMNFWATWCPPCVEEMPSLVQMQQKMKDKGITVLAISLDEDEGAYRRFLQDHNVNLLSVRDAAQKSNELYGTFKFPETYIIDRNGVVRRKFIGPVDWTEPDVLEYLGKL